MTVFWGRVDTQKGRFQQTRRANKQQQKRDAWFQSRHDILKFNEVLLRESVRFRTIYTSRVLCCKQPLTLKNESKQHIGHDPLAFWDPICFVRGSTATCFPPRCHFRVARDVTMEQLGMSLEWLHPGRLTWNIIMEVWKMIFLSKWVIYRFHVNLPGCKRYPP